MSVPHAYLDLLGHDVCEQLGAMDQCIGGELSQRQGGWSGFHVGAMRRLRSNCCGHLNLITGTLVATVFSRLPLALEHPVSATPASEITSERVLLSFGFVATFLHVACKIRGTDVGGRRSAYLAKVSSSSILRKSATRAATSASLLVMICFNEIRPTIAIDGAKLQYNVWFWSSGRDLS